MLWHTSSWTMLCYINIEFPVYTLQISLDSHFLMCVSKNEKKVCFLPLEENSDAIRLNFSIKKIQECYVSGDEESLILTNMHDEIEVWNLKSKIREKLFSNETYWNSISVSSNPGSLFM